MSYRFEIFAIILKSVFQFQSSDLIVYLKEQLDSKEKELFVVVSKEVEEKQLWIHQYALNNHTSPQSSVLPHTNNCESPASSVASLSQYDYTNRDAECLKVMDVRNCAVSDENNL